MNKIMHRFSGPVLLVILATAASSCHSGKTGNAHADYPIQPVPFTEVEISDRFWAGRIETNHRVTIPIALGKSRETGRIDNFRVAAGLLGGDFRTLYPFDDSDVYKIIEGAAYSLERFPDPLLGASVDSLVTLIGQAQEKDGYLYTNRTIMGERAHPWAGSKRWEKVDELSHELYNLGHFFEAAAAWYQATGKREILDIAIRSADLADRDFGRGKIENWPGHQEVEIGLVKLFRLTGEPRYLDLAKFFLDIRGRGTGHPDSYNQSHLPVTLQSEAVGHSVRAAYMWSAMADVAALTGDTAYAAAIGRIWEDVAFRKLYITGGIGAEGGHEGFSGPYELPNARAYCETCAAIANVFWNHRMFLMTGESKYIDLLERSLYNNVLSGVSLSGDRFFYPNPLESDGRHRRSEWFGCACCPSNLSRFIPSMPGYIYARSGSDLYVNLYVPGKTRFPLRGDTLCLEQSGSMPWDGRITLTVSTPHPVRATLRLRIPGWASDDPFPGDLYRWTDSADGDPSLQVNGSAIPCRKEKGYLLVTRKWKEGDQVGLVLPYRVRRIAAHPALAENQGKTALQLGPLVYCTESVDYENPGHFDLRLEKDPVFSYEWQEEELGGINRIYGKAVTTGPHETGTPSIAFSAIPYYAWAHRGPARMAVWIPAGH